MTVSNAKYGIEWNREELILALYYYCQIPFAKTKANNPEVIKLAQILGRSPSSVARKLGNFGAFDPVLAKKGITGLTHYSKSDKAVWTEYAGHWDALVKESQKVLANLEIDERKATIDKLEILRIPKGATERQIVGVQRVYQDFFRRSVLASYDFNCCVCSADIPILLNASHIIPWSVDKEQRTNPENGLCLCVLHDRAFDRGILAVDNKMIISISREARKSRNEFIQKTIVDYAEKPIRAPRRFSSRPEFLTWHYQNIFIP
ncbi:MAG: HNH endonuclease [Dissulfurispiraceae bacterium]|jgi:putative restriction endonuclease|nr:HNH endonuclease [Dissulfurispiraceae bacterium]